VSIGGDYITTLEAEQSLARGVPFVAERLDDHISLTFLFFGLVFALDATGSLS
jgi:hypothetical protein